MGRARQLLALPFVVLALLMQLGAPTAAARMAAAMADPFASMPVCAPGQAKPGPSDPHSPANHHDMSQCAVCSACAPVHAPPVEAGDHRPSIAVAALARPRSPVEAAPRGPPLLRPNARGPPLNA